jgi:penicillin-binding protein 1A
MNNPLDNDPYTKAKPYKKSSFLLEIDAWIDSTLYEAKFAAGEIWEDITIFFRRFRPYGFKRAIFEVLGEGFTLGTGGLILMLALALPAADEISSNWMDRNDFAVTFLDRYGNEIGQRGILHSEAIPIEELPDHLIKAVLATEDRRFFEHYGLDFFGLARAMTENVRANSVVQGGSTLSQQLAKNLFLTNERTLDRKVKEAFLALWLETNLTKDEILKLYLDRAYMGGGTFGVAAATEFYFDKNARDLTLAESAILAGLFKAPAKYAPHVNLPAARARANEVLTNMVQAEFLTEGQVTGARRNPADVVLRNDVDSPDYFLDWAFDEVKQFIVDNKIPSRSVVVRTTVDLNLQQATEESIEFYLRQNGREYNVTESAAVLIENNGAVRALVGGRDYGLSQFNRATRAERQVGSSFKPFVYAAALETGLKPDSVVADAPITWRGWSPQNYNRRFSGRVTLSNALARSINTVPVRLTRDFIGGTQPVVDLAHKMGVESEISGHHTMVLGTHGMTVLDQATGYMTFATGGIAGLRHGFTQIMSTTGEILYDRRTTPAKTERVLSEGTDIAMNNMLVGVTEFGTARRAAIEGFRIAGKTGTTQSYRDAWFVGYTGNFTAAVWYGNDDYTPTNRLTGGRLPAETFQRIMSFAHQGAELKPLIGVENSIPQPETDDTPQETEGNDGEDGSTIAQIRPRSLSKATSEFLQDLAVKLENTPPLKRDPQRVSSTNN